MSGMRIRDYMDAVSKYRGHIMGFSILCILFFHGGVRLAEPWNYFMNLLWGVDIFFFCTGMGLHRSLSRGGDTLDFYKRRFARIYPAYLPIVLIYFILVFINAVPQGKTLSALCELLGNITMLGWINQMDNQFNWYPQVICLLYLAAPLFYLLISRMGGDLRRHIGFFALLLVSQICFFNSHFLIAWSRLLYFVMGMTMAELAERRPELKLNRGILIIAFLIGNYLMYYGQRFSTEILWGYGLSWYPGLLIVPGALFLLPLCFALLERVNWLGWINSIFSLMGKWSFEIFLVHLLIFTYLEVFSLTPSNNLGWLLLIILCVPVSIGYGRIIESVKR